MSLGRPGLFCFCNGGVRRRILFILLCISFVYIFVNFLFGISAFAILSAAIKISQKNGDEFKVKTLREVVEKMTWENYKNSRRNPASINKTEIESILTNWFKDNLSIDILDRQSSFD
jgi:hypothetical protein